MSVQRVRSQMEKDVRNKGQLRIKTFTRQAKKQHKIPVFWFQTCRVTYVNTKVILKNPLNPL